VEGDELLRDGRRRNARRGSLEACTRYYQAALGTNSNPGWLTPNEVREDDGWNLVGSGLDEVMSPLTVTTASSNSGASGAIAASETSESIAETDDAAKEQTGPASCAYSANKSCKASNEAGLINA
jgi:hypothetical protein